VSRYLVVDVEVVVAEQSHGLRQLPQRITQRESKSIVKHLLFCFFVNPQNYLLLSAVHTGTFAVRWSRFHLVLGLLLPGLANKDVH